MARNESLRALARSPRIRGYALALGAVGVAALLTLWQAPHLSRVIFMFFWPAVLVAAWFGGRGPGLLVVVLSLLFVDYLLVRGAGFVVPDRIEDWMALGLFAGFGTVMTELASGLRRAERRAGDAERMVRERARELEDQAIELEAQQEEAAGLTEELRQANEELHQANAQLATMLGETERSAQAEVVSSARARRLLTLSTALSDAITVDEVADIIVREGMAAVHAQAAALATLTHPDGDDTFDGTAEFTTIRRSGYTEPLTERFRRYPLQSGRPLSDAVLARQPVFLESSAEWRRRYPDMAAKTPELTYEAMANVPIMSHGRPIAGLSFNFRSPQRFDESTRTFLATVGEQCGIALGRAQAFEAERRARERSAFLSEASRLLAGSLEFESTLHAVARAAVPRLGDWCAVDMLADPRSKEWPPRIARLAVVHQDPAKIAWSAELEGRLPTDWDAPTGLGRVLREGATEFYASIPDEMLVAAAKSPEHLALLRELQLSALIIVPLVARGLVLGALTLVMTESGRGYEVADRDVAEDLAQRAAVAVDNALLYREAERARAQAEEANRAKSEFLATMSHELRTPLNAIAGYTELLEMEIHGPLTDQQREALLRVRRSEQTLLSLIEDVLNFARLESGRMTYYFADVPVDETLAGLEAFVIPQLESKGLTYRYCHIDPTITVWADREKLEQIMLNLLTNAIKFTEKGEVTVECEPTPHDVTVRVRDTGIGIAPEKLAMIFEPFVQVQSALTRTTHGSGLGLAISRDLAVGMAGALTVASELGVGSTFALRLPRSEGTRA